MITIFSLDDDMYIYDIILCTYTHMYTYISPKLTGPIVSRASKELQRNLSVSAFTRISNAQVGLVDSMGDSIAKTQSKP